MRQTQIHRQILELLSRSPSPLSAADLLEQVSANKTTVYRQLSSLVRRGQVQEVRFSDRRVRYEPASRAHHHHLICTGCDTVTDIHFPEDVQSLAQNSASASHFRILNHYLEFFGLCAKCQAI